MRFKFNKKDKLKSKKQIEYLFENGKSIVAYPLLLKYCEAEFNDDATVKTAISVSKKRYKKAIDRNKIKRLVREVFRLNKPYYFNNLETQYALMILYIGTEKPVFSSLNNTIKELLIKFKTKISKQD